jgi:hypothetical protein
MKLCEFVVVSVKVCACVQENREKEGEKILR